MKSTSPNKVSSNMRSFRNRLQSAIQSHRFTAANSSNDEAHHAFLQVVEDAMEDLIVSNGYSRERATKAILHAITRSIAPSTVTLTDAQLFETMQRYHLGIEQATRALTVSKTLEHIVKSQNVSYANAISHLTHHLRKAKLTSADPYDYSSDESESGPVIDRSVQITLPEQHQKQQRSHVSMSEQRIVSGPSQQSPYVRKTKAALLNTTSGIKHSRIETPKRERSDSFTEEVAAKLTGDAVSSDKGVQSIISRNFEGGLNVGIGAIGTNNGSVSGTRSSISTSTPLIGRGTKRGRPLPVGVGSDESDSDPLTGGSSKRSKALY